MLCTTSVKCHNKHLGYRCTRKWIRKLTRRKRTRPRVRGTQHRPRTAAARRGHNHYDHLNALSKFYLLSKPIKDPHYISREEWRKVCLKGSPNTAPPPAPRWQQATLVPPGAPGQAVDADADLPCPYS